MNTYLIVKHTPGKNAFAVLDMSYTLSVAGELRARRVLLPDGRLPRPLPRPGHGLPRVRRHPTHSSHRGDDHRSGVEDAIHHVCKDKKIDKKGELYRYDQKSRYYDAPPCMKVFGEYWTFDFDLLLTIFDN